MKEPVVVWSMHTINTKDGVMKIIEGDNVDKVSWKLSPGDTIIIDGVEEVIRSMSISKKFDGSPGDGMSILLEDRD